MRRRLPSTLRRIVALAAVIAIPSARAATVRPVNLEEMAARAATIFSGRCLAVRTIHDDALGAEVTVVTFRVDRAVKGDPGPTHTIRLLDGERQAEGGRGPAAPPAFRPGEEVVVFLYGESSLGLSTPVGMGQGKFAVLEDKHGEKIALNALGNQALWRGLSPEAAARLQPHLRTQPPGRGVGPSALLDMVEALAP
jgi:hypothetical protein